MSKRIVLVASVFGLLCFAGNAFGDAKSDAQAKVDAAKTEVCEKSKKFLAEQETKGKCKAENDEAKKLTCSASTSKQVTDLQTRCITAKPVKEDKPEPVAGGTKCRALDPKDEKIVFAEAEDKLSTKCVRLLTAELQKKWCSAENKGKKFEYVTNYDHTIGTGKFAKQIKGKASTHTCRVVNK